ncbi:MAG TPA: UDP-N-acetylmuramate dehydrogenase [Mobilitalea sp.]|nr:UDP-N-acetylmuramate dehydrogenase [Mobilitalea sp.]
MEQLFIQELYNILPVGQVKEKERMEFHTSLHIGGEADYMVTPSSVEEIQAVVRLCNSRNMSYYILGNGSNLLVSDQGYRGLILKLGENFSNITIGKDGIVTAQAGVLLSRLANSIARQGLTGFEFAAGIPGTLGGAVTMNAGAYDGEMKQYIVTAKVMNQAGDILDLNNEELELDYRRSILQVKDYVLLEATLLLNQGDKDQITARIKELNSLRREKQPLEQYSAGSTFKRPTGFYAPKLIHEAGLSGYRVGDAEVSTKHCGFLINRGNATAEDFLKLMQDVKCIVEEKFSVTLEPEVKLLGF